MKKIIFISATLIAANFACFSQPLKIGDKCPDLEFSNVLYYKTNTIKLSQFKARLIVLDYWDCKCVPCIESFQKIDSLQKQFQGTVQFIAINRQSYDSTKRFFALRKNIKLPQIPFITGDSILLRMFQVKAVPTHVWIDSTLTVRFITDGSYATSSNILSFLNKKPLDFYQLVDLPEKIKLDISSSLDYYSYIAPAVPGTFKDFTNGVIKNDKIYFTSERSSIIELLKNALGNIENHKFNWFDSVILQVSDKNRFRNIYKIDKNKWNLKNLYSYYLMLPKDKKDQLYYFIKQDIERYFRITSKIETRKVFYYILIKKGNCDKLKSLGGTPVDCLRISTIIHPVNDSVRKMNNISFEKFSDRIGTYIQGTFGKPFKDETGIKENIDIQLDAAAIDSGNLMEIRKQLWKYNMDVVEELRDRKVLVIRDN